MLAALTTANALQQWSYLVGILLPLLVAFIQQPRWTATVRACVAVASCIVAATITTWLDTGLDLSNWLGSMARVLVAAHATYLAFWKPTGIAPWFEWLTSPHTRANGAAHRARLAHRTGKVPA